MSFKICVSGAAEGDCLNPQTLEKAEKVEEIPPVVIPEPPVVVEAVVTPAVEEKKEKVEKKVC